MKPRVVLDTQIWLDWVHYDDPRCAALDHLHSQQAIELCIDAPCRAELLCVLAYPRFALDACARQARIDRVDALSTLLALADQTPGARLPRCRDPDDQKFVQLAVACDARVLLSRDHALLALHRRLQRDFALAVVPAEQLLEALGRASSPTFNSQTTSPEWT